LPDVRREFLLTYEPQLLYILGAMATELQVLSLNAPGQAASIQNVDISGSAKQTGLALSALNLQAMTPFIQA
jgi:hypothetical protein